MAKDKKTLKILSDVNQAFIESFPNSKKIYVSGSQEGVNVPMREITLTDTIGDLAEKNDPIHVYDTSGVYTDPNVVINFQKGLKPIREKWIENRGDTERLNDFSSEFSNQRLNDKSLDDLRFKHINKPRKAKEG